MEKLNISNTGTFAVYPCSVTLRTQSPWAAWPYVETPIPLASPITDYRVIVSHPIHQGFAYQTVKACQENDIRVNFLTGLYYKPEALPFRLIDWLPGRWAGGLRHRLEKRRLAGLDPEAVTLLSGPLPDIARRLFRGYRAGNAIHDRLAGRWLRRHVAKGEKGIYHGFLGSCLGSLKIARARGLATVLEITSPPSAGVMVAQEHRRLGRTDIQMPDLSVELAEIGTADYLVAQSSFGVTFLIDQGVPAQRIFLLPLGADTARFHPLEAPRSEPPFRGLFVGRLSVSKGLHHLLQAWSELDLPQAELVLVGNPVDKHGTALLERYRGTYRRLGFVTHERLPEVYRDCDIFVFPSLAEGGALVISEALASGLPCVVSANAPSVLRDGLEGYIVPVGDVAALKERILRLHSDRALRTQMAAAARRRAEDFSWTDYYRRVGLMYGYIMNTKRPAGGVVDLSGS